MRTGSLFVSAVALAALFALTIPAAQAGKFNSKVEIGDQAADWSNLIGTDDRPHALADYKGKKAVVMVFTCNHCPVAIANEDRLIALQKEYASKGVQVVAVNVNNGPEDTLEPMKERAQDKAFNFPYLYDPTQKIAKDYGATVTPHVFLLDGARKIVYMGAIDDEPLNPSAVTKPYLKNAIDAVLAGKSVEVSETKQHGCGIKYDK